MKTPFEYLEPNSKPPKPKVPLGKVVLINFGIMLGYMALLSLDDPSMSGMTILGRDMIFIFGQIALNLLAGLAIVFTQVDHIHTPDRQQLGKALIIGGFLMGIIGFGTCLLHTSIFEN